MRAIENNQPKEATNKNEWIGDNVSIAHMSNSLYKDFLKFIKLSYLLRSKQRKASLMMIL